MYLVELGIPERIGETSERPFVVPTVRAAGKLSLPFIGEFDRLGVHVLFEGDEIPDSFYGTPTHMEAKRTITEDELAVRAITIALDKRLSRDNGAPLPELGGQS